VTIGTGLNRKRCLRFSEEDLKRKSIDFDVPAKVEIKSNNEIFSGPDNFDLIIPHDMGDISGTGGTGRKNEDEGKNERAGTVGTVGTGPGGIDAQQSNSVKEKDDITSDTSVMLKTLRIDF
jgi:hypothetical protein